MTEQNETNTNGSSQPKEKPARTRKASEYIVQMRLADAPDDDYADCSDLRTYASPEAAVAGAEQHVATLGQAFAVRIVRVVDEGVIHPKMQATIERAKGYRRSR